jgi:hypothetical protein
LVELKELSKKLMTGHSKKWLLWGSVIAFLLSVSVVLYASFVETASEIYAYISIPILILSVLNLIALFSLRYSERKWLRNIAGFSLYILLFSIFGYYLLYDNLIPTDTHFKIFLEVLFIILISLSCLFTLINIFLLKEAGKIIGLMVLLLLIVISLILQRFFLNNIRTEDYFFTAFIILTLLTGCGMYLFGVSCLFKVEKNSYLKIVSYLAGLFIAFGSLIFALIMSSERVHILELIYFIPAILLTLIVLLSLPVSGYINWSSLHKKILKKIMISWLFFFLIFSVRFVFPEYFRIIEIKSYNPGYHFDMKDYELQNKNGLKPE